MNSIVWTIQSVFMCCHVNIINFQLLLFVVFLQTYLVRKFEFGVFSYFYIKIQFVVLKTDLGFLTL